MKNKILITLFILSLIQGVFAQGDGFIQKNGKRIFPIGSYYLPKDDASLKEMISAGFNLFACGSKEDLDRLQKFGVQGWIFLPLEQGASDNMKKIASSVAGHPALAVWGGPDELVWGFTANSALYREKIHKSPGEWSKLSPEALKYAKEQSEIIMPKIHEAVDYLRRIDPNNLQLWINEANGSDMGYVGEYMDAIDISGCDIYPIESSRVDGSTKGRSSMQDIGKDAKRWTAISGGKPIWMVLQAFSWNELSVIDKKKFKNRPIAYPSFEESRYMAYDVIANGAHGVLYWNMAFLTNNEFRQSIYALTSELNALQPFLTTDSKPISITNYQKGKDPDTKVAGTVRQYGRDWIVALVNESDTAQMGVVVNGLPELSNHKLVELYGDGDDDVVVRDGKFITRMRPFEVKVFATSRKWEAADKNGRAYLGL